MISLQLGDTVEILPPINRPGSPKTGTVVFIFPSISAAQAIDKDKAKIMCNQLRLLCDKHRFRSYPTLCGNRKHTSYLILVPTGKSGTGKGRLLYPPVSRLRKLPTRQPGMQGFHERGEV